MTAPQQHTGAAGPGSLVSAWGEDAWRDSVILACPRGAIHAVIEGLRRVSAASPALVMVQAGAVAVGGLDPGLVGGLVAASDAGRWMRAPCPLVRLRPGGADDARARVGCVLRARR